jgi:hypothetical protein
MGLYLPLIPSFGLSSQLPLSNMAPLLHAAATIVFCFTVGLETWSQVTVDLTFSNHESKLILLFSCFCYVFGKSNTKVTNTENCNSFVENCMLL